VGLGNASHFRGPSGQENARSFFARPAKGAAAGARTPPRLDQTETKRLTRASGCRCGLTTWTRSTGSAWPPGWTSTFPPADMPWNVREMHVRHPDGHVFQVSKGIADVA